MKQAYENKVKKMIQNYEALKQEFKWENDMVKHLLALTYVMKDYPLETGKIKEMTAYIKSQTGFFSPYRDKKVILGGLLCASFDKAQQQFDTMLANESSPPLSNQWG